MLNRDWHRWMTNDAECQESFRPEHTVGPYLTVTDAEIENFNDAFSDEIDSDFASSICCCDACLDDFKDHWPDVPFRKMEFQNQTMDVFYAVENTRLPGVWSPSEISTLRHFVKCKRCGEYVRGNISFYEHTFSNVAVIERQIDELLMIGDETPFLLLEHEFARRILVHIRGAFEGAGTLAAGTSLFRARTAASISSSGQHIADLQSYAPPPARLATEGRFNHAGMSMLYLASSPEVASSEIAAPGEPCLIAQLVTTCPLVLLDLVDIDEDDPGYEMREALANSALLAAPRTGEGWLKKEYVFSRFVADCARAAGYDAIRYASTKQIEGNNIVVLVPPTRIEEIAFLAKVDHSVGQSSTKRC